MTSLRRGAPDQLWLPGINVVLYSRPAGLLTQLGPVDFDGVLTHGGEVVTVDKVVSVGALVEDEDATLFLDNELGVELFLKGV